MAYITSLFKAMYPTSLICGFSKTTDEYLLLYWWGDEASAPATNDAISLVAPCWLTPYMGTHSQFWQWQYK